jgi:hypothetical protein
MVPLRRLVRVWRRLRRRRARWAASAQRLSMMRAMATKVAASRAVWVGMLRVGSMN